MRRNAKTVCSCAGRQLHEQVPYRMHDAALSPVSIPSPSLFPCSVHGCHHSSLPNLSTLASHDYRYGMREALAIASEEGLEAMWARHQQVWPIHKTWHACCLLLFFQLQPRCSLCAWGVPGMGSASLRHVC